MVYLKMSFLIMFFVLTFSRPASTSHYVGGKTNLSKEGVDNMEIERQLIALNKKPVKTIITEVGDVIDCIDIYKQPAFDNPLLKDHKIQMRTRSIPGETRSEKVSTSSIFHGLQRERCPLGTIPIRRITREHLVFAKKVKQIHANGFPNIRYHSVYAEEIISGKFIRQKKYYGGSASMSIHNLTVDHDQFSTSQIWIANASSPEINGIRVGIMKNPSLVGGNLPRLFGFWIAANGHQVAGCYNMACQGFIQTHPTVFIDQPFVHPSLYGQMSNDVHVKAPGDNGDWWLRMGATAETSEDVGYWPNEIFTLLRNSASDVRYGGYVGSMAQASTPPMGNGFLPQLHDYDTTAYMRLMKYVNEAGDDVDLDPRLVRINKGTVSQCYNIMFAGNIGGAWKNTIAYGGPGGFCQ
ncbi:uncharacterized protein LOC113340548 [Papaver somniferum]|uniref:uncharacterized protein LOC113340548 n=1 Tax=Papaver somniferum TaxID=3469 RepID=UPI000E7027AE|nr:uncharacterized protein LOC113340548 [Papaver somniferum]